MDLGKNQTLFQYFTIKHLDIDVRDGNLLKLSLWQGKYGGRLKRFHLQRGGFFFKQALNAHEDGVVFSQMLCNFLSILEIELSN